jgi:hypothetical protein
LRIDAARGVVKTHTLDRPQQTVRAFGDKSPFFGTAWLRSQGTADPAEPKRDG